MDSSSHRQVGQIVNWARTKSLSQPVSLEYLCRTVLANDVEKSSRCCHYILSLPLEVQRLLLNARGGLHGKSRDERDVGAVFGVDCVGLKIVSVDIVANQCVDGNFIANELDAAAAGPLQLA